MKLIQAPTQGSRPAVPRERRVLGIVGDTQVGLWVLRSLARGGLQVYCVCATERGLSRFSRFSAGAWRLEFGPDDPRFVEDILALARQLDVGSVLTIAESFHQALVRDRHRFEPDIHVFSPPAEAFEKATDKNFMHAMAVDLGVPVARGTTLDKLMAPAGGFPLAFPLVLRTSKQSAATGTAPWKAAYAADSRQLEDLCHCSHGGL